MGASGDYAMKFGITQSFDCSYLPGNNERLLVYAESDDLQALHYSQLIQVGFRRSGEQIYRPHCQSCHACQSVRVPVKTFTPTKSQKRIVNRNAHFTIQVSHHPKESYYPLYEAYITKRHQDGSMYPPSRDQFNSFILCHWKAPIFIEAYDGDTLIAVAVTDDIDNLNNHGALSALYTFFHPDYHQHSLGTWMILMQIATAETLQKPFVYLGYFVDGCQKMSYKQQFRPFEQFIGDHWVRFDKKPT